MSKKNFNVLKLFLFLPLPFLLASCVSNEKKIIGLGFFILILFLCCWIATIILPKVQEAEKVKEFIRQIKAPIKLVSNILIFLFIILSVFFVFTGEGIQILLGAVFGIGIVGLHYLKKWATSTGSVNNKIELKMVAVSITFIIALIWLIFYGTAMLRL